MLKDSTKRLSSGEILWVCKCQCGNTKDYSTTKLTSGRRVSCGSCTKDSLGNKATGKNASNYVTKIKRRKGKSQFSSLTRDRQLLIIDEYLTKGLSVEELSDTYKIDPRSLRDSLRVYRDKLNNTFELNYLISTQKTYLPQVAIDKALSSQFSEPLLQPLMSLSDSKVLTNEEMLYAWFFVNTGNNEVALKEAGFTRCLKVKDGVRKNLLGIFLREKTNIASYIRELRLTAIEQIDVSKGLIQNELITQITQLRELTSVDSQTPQHRTQLIRAIELLGKTTGAFEDKIKIETVNPTEALDMLIELSKEEASYSIEELEKED
ncbi:MAG: hypothetical protein KAS32_25240 [Candidatus Peribacteraceae bacterium]|nr:hypothetical protein [Candidatus Peribacteraceae bacterium]